MADVPNWQKWTSLFVLSLALAIIVIDTTILNVSLGVIIREFNTTIQNIQWVITAYALTLAALTVTGGRLGDLFGRKKMFVLGAIIFAIGSFVTSISQGIPVMIAGESIIEGVGAALMMPATASLLVSIFHGRERAIAFGVWGGVAAAASAIGPILGGFLTTHYSWRWAFRINVFVALLLLIGSMLLHEYRDEEEKPTLDFIGVLLSSVGLLAVVFGIIEASSYGWWLAKQPTIIGDTTLTTFNIISFVPWTIAAGLIVLGLFLLWQNYIERQGKTPLISLKLFTNRQFSTGSITTMILTLGMTGLIFILPVFFQSVRELDALHTGFALLPMSLSVLVAAPLSGFLSSRLSPKYLVQIGLLFVMSAPLLLRSELNINATVWTLTPGLIFFGIGLGLVMAQVSNITLSAVSVQQAGEASGVNNTLRQVGSSFGSALIGAVLLSTLSTNLHSGIMNSQDIPEAAKPAISQAVDTQTAT